MVPGASCFAALVAAHSWWGPSLGWVEGRRSPCMGCVLQVPQPYLKCWEAGVSVSLPLGGPGTLMRACLAAAPGVQQGCDAPRPPAARPRPCRRRGRVVRHAEPASRRACKWQPAQRAPLCHPLRQSLARGSGRAVLLLRWSRRALLRGAWLRDLRGEAERVGSGVAAGMQAAARAHTSVISVDHGRRPVGAGCPPAGKAGPSASTMRPRPVRVFSGSVGCCAPALVS
jgi:hypothetical protein